MGKELLKGNHAMAEAAVRAGVQAYFGYPITPQTEILEYLSARMPELGRVFVQAESELGAANMLYGAACTGVRAMSSSSSPGASLMMEAISYIAATEVPVVLIDAMRGGPGLGNVAPAQGDYNQIVHGGGHGDYHVIALAPASVQEAIDLTVLSFDLADRYRCISVVLPDGAVGQMMEPAELPAMHPVRTSVPEWAVSGCDGREKRFLSSFHLEPSDAERATFRLQQRWQEIQKNEVRYAQYYLDDAKIAVVGFGTAGRVALSAVRMARSRGIPVGLVRPISLSPFPAAILEELAKQVDAILVVEMNSGQMLEDVRCAVRDQAFIDFYGRLSGVVPYPEEIFAEIERIAKEYRTPAVGHPRDRWISRMSRVLGGGVAS